MNGPLIIAIPSKGRLKDQVEAWLADCGLDLVPAGAARGYLARIVGFDDLQARLASASDIAAALTAGDVHLGITGEDLLGETAEAVGRRVLLLMGLGFGRADLVVAAPKSWVDVETMADVEDVARLYLARTGRRLRVATKYPSQTRAFFARHAVADYRLTESAGATEGAPAAGTAELVVDITSSGATLAANGLRPISDGLILASQAQLAAAVGRPWSESQVITARRLLRILEARARGRTHVALNWPAAQDRAARGAVAGFVGSEPEGGQHGAIVPLANLFGAMEVLAAAQVGPVTAARPAYIFEAASPAADHLAEALAR